MNKRAKHAADWAFAITSFFSFWFLLALFGGLFFGADFNLRFGGYSYSGPVYSCLPAMLIGLFSLGGTCMYLALSFHEGRQVARHDSECRQIAKAVGCDLDVKQRNSEQSAPD